MVSLQALKACVLPLHYTRSYICSFHFATQGVFLSNARLRYLPQWIDILSVYVAGWSTARPQKGRTAEALPAPLLMLALRGEGVLRLRFADWATHSPLAAAPDQSLMLWNSLWDDGAEIKPLCERIGLALLASEHTAIPVPTWPVQRALYACFVARLAQEQRDDLLQLVTDKLFALALARQFPAAAVTPERVTLSTLQQRAHIHIQKALARPVKLRERALTETETAHFTLRVAVDKGGWQDLLEFHGPRLKPLKMQAYQAALDLEATVLRERLL